MITQPNPTRELIAVITAWLNREGDLPGLLAAWLEVTSGQVKIHSIRPSYLTDHTAIIAAIRHHQHHHGYSPTIAQIAKATPLTQEATSAHIAAMLQDGTAAITISRPKLHARN